MQNLYLQLSFVTIDMYTINIHDAIIHVTVVQTFENKSENY
jgi:hypothetical protein